MSLIDGSALKGFSDGLFTALRFNQMGARSAASSRYRQESTRNLELQNEAIEERAQYDRLIENPEIQNLLISKIPTGEILKLDAIKPKDFTFDPNNTESLLSSDVANELATITLVDRLGLPKGSRAQIVDASQLFSGTGTIPENSVAIQVINPDGSMGVLTKNGSNADDAEVVFKTKEEMAQHFNSILNTAKSKSGLYNDFITAQAMSELSNTASINYYNSYVDANSNAREISNTFSQVMATKPERTPETENDVTNRTAFSLFKQDVQNKLKLLDPTTQREIFNNVELAGNPLNEYQILTRVANEINKINTDVSQVGETLKINIPKIESSFLKQLQTFDPTDDQDTYRPSKDLGQPRANTYQELIKQIVELVLLGD